MKRNYDFLGTGGRYRWRAEDPGVRRCAVGARSLKQVVAPTPLMLRLRCGAALDFEEMLSDRRNRGITQHIQVSNASLLPELVEHL